jgi:hypothetical protein
MVPFWNNLGPSLAKVWITSFIRIGASLDPNLPCSLHPIADGSRNWPFGIMLLYGAQGISVLPFEISRTSLSGLVCIRT